MKTSADFELPPELERELRRAVRLEWGSIAYLLSVTVLMYLVMGSSQAMRTAWLEDVLSLIPPIGFLIAVRVRYRRPTVEYPYGYHRALNIAFFFAALALLSMGCLLLLDACVKLLQARRATIGTVQIFERHIWLGWPMLAVLLWATIPVVFLGRRKLRIARHLHDKPLYADAEMNKADWLTGSAAMLGVLGIGIGWWWADSAAAAFISLDILRDGLRNLRTVVGDLMDRRPRTVDNREPIELPQQLRQRLEELAWVESAEVRLREHGHVMFGEALLTMRNTAELDSRLQEADRLIRGLDWRLHDVVVQLRGRKG